MIDDGTGTNSGCSTWTSSDAPGEEPLQQIGSNAFSVDKTGYGNRTFYFNHKLWRWICTDRLELDIRCYVGSEGLIQIQPASTRRKFTAIGPKAAITFFLNTSARCDHVCTCEYSQTVQCTVHIQMCMQ